MYVNEYKAKLEIIKDNHSIKNMKKGIPFIVIVGLKEKGSWLRGAQSVFTNHIPKDMSYKRMFARYKIEDL